MQARLMHPPTSGHRHAIRYPREKPNGKKKRYAHSDALGCSLSNDIANNNATTSNPAILVDQSSSFQEINFKSTVLVILSTSSGGWE